MRRRDAEAVALDTLEYYLCIIVHTIGARIGFGIVIGR